MSQQQTEKPRTPPAWWVLLLVGAFFNAVFGNLVPILALIETGVISLSHVGVGQFVLVLTISLVCSAVGFIIGVRLCITAILTSIAAIFNGVRRGAQIDPATQHSWSRDQVVLAEGFGQPLSAPPTRWQNVQDKFYDFLVWLFVPKRFRT